MLQYTVKLRVESGSHINAGYRPGVMVKTTCIDRSSRGLLSEVLWLLMNVSLLFAVTV